MKVGDAVQGLKDTYTVEAIVGEGGFGVTYRAIGQSNKKAVALKQMRIEKLDSWKALELFEREAKVLKGLNHPCIPSYVEFFATTPDGPVDHFANNKNAPESLVLVQHFAEGKDLREKLKQGAAFSTVEMSKILKKVLEALAYLHELNPPVIHRDVTPKNIIVAHDGQVFLVDFGAIQHKLHEETVGGSTAVGTLGFIPLEQSLGKARPASDLYALAVSAVVLMTGMLPEDLPLDDSTSKIDLEKLGLVHERGCWPFWIRHWSPLWATGFPRRGRASIYSRVLRAPRPGPMAPA
jgi:serine/threonine protein kinase